MSEGGRDVNTDCKLPLCQWEKAVWRQQRDAILARAEKAEDILRRVVEQFNLDGSTKNFDMMVEIDKHLYPGAPRREDGADVLARDRHGKPIAWREDEDPAGSMAPTGSVSASGKPPDHT